MSEDRLTESAASSVEKQPEMRQALLPALGAGALGLVVAFLLTGLFFSLNDRRPAADEVVAPDAGIDDGSEANPLSASSQQDAEKTATAGGDEPSATGSVQLSDQRRESGKSKEPSAEEALAKAEASEPAPNPVAGKENPESPKGPWDHSDHLGGPVRPVDEAAYSLPPVAADPLESEETLRRWFAGAPGENHKLAVKEHRATITGVVRLRAPLSENAVLRLAVRPESEFFVHCWRGEQGVTLRAAKPSPEVAWAGYVTTRKENEPQPTTWALTSTDSGRAWRSAGLLADGTRSIDVRYQRGAIVVSRGDVPLITVPFDGPPEEVYFEGRLMLDAMRMLRMAPLPDETPPPRTVVMDETSPAQLAWRTELPEGAAIDKLEDGRVRLSATSSKSLAWAGVPLPADGAYEIVMQLDDLTPGVGVYLGDSEGKPALGPKFVEEARTGNLIATLLAVMDDKPKLAFNFDSGPLPLVGRSAWVRLLCAGGKLNCWVSADGERWGQAWSPQRASLNGGTFGVFCGPVEMDRQITVRRVIVRSFPVLHSLASAEARVKAPIVVAEDFRRWREAALKARPQEFAPEAWLRACAIRNLAVGGPGPLSTELAQRLLADGLASDRSVDAKLDLLDELATVADTWSEGQKSLAWPVFAKAYEQLGIQLRDAGHADLFSTIHRRAVRLPLWTSDRFFVQLPELERAEMLTLAADARWPQLTQLTRELETFGLSGKPDRNRLEDLIAWAKTTAGRRQGLRDEERGESAPLRPAWRHPLEIEISREGFNVLAELEAALEGNAPEDACRIITTANPTAQYGLLPAARDPAAWLSFAIAVDDTMRRYPAVQQLMRGRFGRFGELRLNRAAAAGATEKVGALAVQFHGTPASAGAHRWLGDRALAAGKFARAVYHYDHAAAAADSAIAHSLAPRLRLAHAMLGRNWGEPVPGPVTLGDVEFTPADFERIVADAQAGSRHAPGGNGSGASVGEPAAAAPPPAGYRADLLADMGEAAGRVNDGLMKLSQEQDSDWVAVQLGWTIAGNRLITSDGKSASAYSLSDGQLEWRTRVEMGGGNPDEKALIPHRPTAAGEYVVCRGFAKAGYGLVCLNDEKGLKQWEVASPDNREFVSDPVIAGDEVFVVGSYKQLRGRTLQLCVYDLRNGTPLRESALLGMGSGWDQYRVCVLSAVEDALLVATGGALLCVDRQGEPRWLRRQFWLPGELHPDWVAQHTEPPLVHDGLVFATQPGVPVVECIELAAGRQRWQRAMPSLRRLVRATGDGLVIEVGQDLVCLDPTTGEVRWRRHVPGSPTATLSAAGDHLVYARQGSADRGKEQTIQLRWLRSSDGRPLAAATLSQLKHKEPLLGLFTAQPDGALWGMYGDGYRNPRRRLVRLRPEGTPDEVATESQAIWTP